MQLKIWHKMVIGIAIPSIIALIGGILTYRYIKDIENRQNYVEMADDFKEKVLEVRRNEKTFLHFKNSLTLNQLHNEILSLRNLTRKVSQQSAAELGDQDYPNLTQNIETYPELVNILYQYYQQESSVVDQVRAEGRKLEEYAESGIHAKALSKNFILNLRRFEKNYMLFRDRTSFRELTQGLTQLKDIIPGCNECAPYLDSMNTLFEIHKKSDTVLNKLQYTGNQMEEVTARIALRERQRIGQFLARIKNLLFVALMLVSVLGPLFIYTTATNIVTPIKRLARITKQIAEGNRDLRAPIKEHDETYDLALSFNKMLDNLDFTHHSLERSMELLKEKQTQLIDSEKRASMGLLVSGVAHELNNPLNNIFLTAETILEDLKEMPEEEVREYVLDILAQSERAQSIVENLLDFARARRSTEMEVLDITDVVDGALGLIENQIRISNIELVENIPERAVHIRGNLSKLEQVIINIILNAIQAISGEGRITVTVREDDEKEHVLIEISDTGHGIPEENLKNIFEPFFTTKTIGEGTGLGLSVSYGLVREHNGDILVKSTVGEGTLFTVVLPLYKPSAA